MAPLQNSSHNEVPPNPRGAELDRVSIALTTSAGVFVAFRIGIRAKRKLLGWDDFWIGFAFINSILLLVGDLMTVEYGFGMHSEYLSEDNIQGSLFWWYLVQVFYKLITWPTKISILLMYRRVFLVDNDIKVYGVPFRNLIWITLAIVIGCFISFQTAGIFQCTPIRRSWNPTVPGHCTAPLERMYAYAACNFITDVIILLLPMPLISRMTHITKRQKCGLMGIFALGGFVCITTLIRVSNLNMWPDVLYCAQAGTLWTSIEANVGIICACLPLMRSVILYFLPALGNRTSSGSSSSGQRGRGRGSNANSNSNPHSQQSADRTCLPRAQNDPICMSYVTKDGMRGLNSSEPVNQEKIRGGLSAETEADSTTDDDGQSECDGRYPT